MDGELLHLAHECADAAEFEARVLAGLQRRIGCDVAFFSLEGDEAFPTTLGLDADTVARAVRRGPKYQSELLPVKRAAQGARGVAVDTRVLGERRVRETAYHRELARPLGGRHSLLALVSVRGRIAAGLMLGRTGAPFTDRDIATMEALLPELGIARASYGLPLVSEPLVSAAPEPWLCRLGMARHPPLARENLGGATLEVRDRNGFREMVARQGSAELVWTRAALSDPSRSGWPYIELLHLAAVLAKHRGRALFVGSGGGVVLRQFAERYPGLRLDLVEREPRVIELARAWYGLGDLPGLTIHIADGADFAERAPASAWDIAVIDAFDASDTTAPLRHPSFFASLHRLLRPGGALAMNLIGALEGPGPVRDVARHLSGAFGPVRVVPVMEPGETQVGSALRNVVLVATKRR